MYNDDVKKIRAEFDFVEVQKVMKLLDWKWSFDVGERRVPSISEMKTFVEGLMCNTIRDRNSGEYGENENIYHSSGGFKVTINEYKRMSLEFVVERVNI